MSTELPAAGTAARRERLARQRATTGTDRVPAGPRGAAADAERRALADPDRQAALEEEREFLLRSIEDLEREHAAGDIDDADFAALRDDYTARAADALRAIEAGEQARGAVPTRSRARLAVVMAAVAVFAVVAGVALARTTGTREAGESMTGDVQQSSRDLLLAAQRQFAAGQYADAVATYDRVLAVHPDNAEALAYKGWLLHLAAQQVPDPTDRRLLDERARASLDAAVQAAPTYADARVFRAVLERSAGDPAAARADLAAVGEEDVPPFMRDMVAQLRASVAGSTGSVPG